MQPYQRFFVWAGILTITAVPTLASLMSPLLAWRQPVYIAGGFAGVVALVLLLFQPLLILEYLPGINRARSRMVHRWVGVSLLVSVVIHVAGLWITSPPDVIDALLFRSPTPFAPWGVVAMGALLLSASLVALRSRLRLRLRLWRLAHKLLAVVIVIGSVAHAMLIDGTMESLSKLVLCVVILVAILLMFKDAVTNR